MRLNGKTVFLVLFGIFIAIVAYFNTKTLRIGPKITVTSPTAYSNVGTLVHVTGHINKSQEATINNRELLVTKNGDFVTDLILTPPLDTIDIWAKNAYGKESYLSIPVAIIDDYQLKIQAASTTNENISTSTESDIIN